MKHTQNAYNLAAEVIEHYFQKTNELNETEWYYSSDLKRRIDEKFRNGPPKELLVFIAKIESTFNITFIDRSVTFLPSWKFEYTTVEQLSEGFTREENFTVVFSCLSNFYTLYRATSFQVPIQSTGHQKIWLPAIIHCKFLDPIGLDSVKITALAEKLLDNYRYINPETCVRPIYGFKAPFIHKEGPSLANFLFHNSHLSQNPVFV